jgi:predicted SAM-dependent methyltransferase
MAETSKYRIGILDLLYELNGNKPIPNMKVIDIGAGDDPILPDCDRFDLPEPYTERCNKKLLTYCGDARKIDEIVTRKYWIVYSSHLLEDFPRNETVDVLTRWTNLLVDGGLLVLLCPDQQKYVEFCKARGELPNVHHQIEDFSLKYLMDSISQIPNMMIMNGSELFAGGDYNIFVIAKKVENPKNSA